MTTRPTRVFGLEYTTPETVSLKIGPKGRSDVVNSVDNNNPILDSGFPKSVGGEDRIKALCKAIGIPFKLKELDYEPFVHSYGKECENPRV